MLKRNLLANRAICLLLAFGLCLCFSGCKKSGEDISGDGVTFNDALGRTVKVQKNPERTAALIGSFADVWQLAGGTLCASANDAWDDFGLDMGDAVKLGTVKKPDVERLFAAQPDFVLASSATAGHVELLEIFENAGITVAYFDISSFDDYIEMLNICTDIIGRKDLFKKNGVVVQHKINEIKEKFTKADIPENQKRILILRVSSGRIRAKGSDDSFFGEMLRDLGCVNIADNDKNLLENLSVESIVKAEPYHIFVVQMGDDAQGVKKNLAKLMEENPAWRELDAVKKSRVHFMDKRLFNLKPNARWGEAYEILCEVLQK